MKQNFSRIKKKKKNPQAPAASPLAFIESDPSLSTFASAIKAANLTSKLNRPDVVLTVFAPTNAAFDAYMRDARIASKAALLADPDLKFLVKQHVVKGDTGVSSGKWTQGQALKSWLSETAPIIVSKEADKKATTVSSAAGPAAKVTKADVAAGAGVVDVVDAVLVAPKPIVESVKAAAAAQKLKASVAPAPAKAAVASVATGGRKMMAAM